MSCKKSVFAEICTESRCCVVTGFLHPAYCMGARYPHLDLKCVNDLWFCGLARVKGAKLPCRNDGVCVIVWESELGLSARLCVRGCCVSCVGDRVYIMRTRSGMLYIGPLHIDC